MAITSWSFSKLMDFETCKLRAYLKHDARVPEPQRPLPEGKTEHANDRGTRIHQGGEDYVNGTRHDLIHELRHFDVEYRHMRNLFADGKVSMEGEWGVDRNWVPTEYRTAWHRSKLDYIVHTSPHTAVITDLKSGRKFGNEMKHGQQVQLYTINSFMRFPELEEVTTELWYCDVNDVTSMTFTRNQALRFKPNFDRRGHAVTDAKDFPPNPNIHSCRWCEYGPWNSGHCKVGVRPNFKGIPVTQ